MAGSDQFSQQRLEEITEAYITRLNRVNNLVMKLITEKHPLAEQMGEAHVDFVGSVIEYYQFWRNWAMALAGVSEPPAES